jgi:glucose-1-phosphate thymidylyltransferase
MIEKGAKIQVVDVEGWYDAGQLETLLDTNRTMLEKGRARRPSTLSASATIIEPVYIEDGCSIENSTVGPNVSLGASCRVRDSKISDAVIGVSTTIMNCTLHHSFIGDSVTVQGVNGSVNAGDNSEILGNT